MDEDLVLLIIGLVLGIVVTILILGSFGTFSVEAELGQAICDQEYNMDYESYDDEELKCQPKVIEQEEQYDGITVYIGNEKERLIQEDLDKVEQYTAKFSHVDGDTAIYLPKFPFNEVSCNFGSWSCSSSYIDSNGNGLFDDDFEDVNSTQYVYCNCRGD